MSGNGLNCRIWQEMTENGWNVRKWLNIAGHCWKWLDGNDWKQQKCHIMAGQDQKWLEMTRNGRNSWKWQEIDKITRMMLEKKIRWLYHSLKCVLYMIGCRFKIIKPQLASKMCIRKYGPLCGPSFSSCGELWPSVKEFSPLWTKKYFFILFLPNSEFFFLISNI